MTQKLSGKILALYFNQINYGGMAYGVEAGLPNVFWKTCQRIIAPGMCADRRAAPGTGIYNPFTNPELAKQRQVIVLGLMEKQGYISHQERVESRGNPDELQPAPYPIEAPHFVWIIKDQIDKMISEGICSLDQSLIVRTTLDLDTQHLAEETLKRHIEDIQEKRLVVISHNVNNAALVVIDPHNGEILALVGSADYFDKSIDGASGYGNLAASNRLRHSSH